MSTSSSSRFHFVDLLRGGAVLVMIETHVMNALLQPGIKDGDPFKILTFINGLVAPSFLFCAGLAFAITLRKKWDDLISGKPVLWRYLARLLFILGVAYSLHVPLFSLRRMMELTDEQTWMVFFQADILHVIALTLLFLALLAVLVRRRSLFDWIVAGVSLAIVFLSPIIREMDLSQLPVWLRPYLTTQFKSQFPLLPWSAFLMTGFLIGAWFLRAHDASRERVFINRLMVFSLAAIVISLAVEVLPVSFYARHDFWRASPEFFFVRLGLVLLALVALWLADQKGTSAEGSVFALFGQESLVVYVAHLMIVYGHTFDWSFIRVYGPTLNYWQSGVLFVVVTVLMYGLAWGWHRLKRWSMTAAKIVQFAVVAGTVCYFVVK